MYAIERKTELNFNERDLHLERLLAVADWMLSSGNQNALTTLTLNKLCATKASSSARGEA